MPTRIVLQDLTKRFDSPAHGAAPSSTLAVDAVCLTIEPGELFFLLGPSGCGKTTLLRMIAGFIEPSAGRILFQTDAGERDVTFTPPNKRNSGMVFQSYALWPHMTVAQNVAFGLDLRAVKGPDRERRVREALDAVQMAPYAARKPNQLSGGQQQRVALARALVIRPDVLLLDEPLSNLDAKLRNELRSEIRKICKSAGITGVYVTHDQKEALSMADRVAVVRAGRIVQVASPAKLYRRPRNTFVAQFLGETNLIPARIIEKIEPPPAATPPNPKPSSHIVVQTSIGRLRSASVSRDVDVDALLNHPDPASAPKVLVSVRPEALAINAGAGVNTLFAAVRETTYLGETAQLIARLAPGSDPQALAMHHALGNTPVDWKIATLNPGPRSCENQAVTLSIDPDDVVVLPAD